MYPAISRGASPRLAYSRFQTDANIWRLDLSRAGRGQPAAKLIASSRRDCAPQYSPDGKRIAFHSDRSGGTQLWVVNGDGSNALQLTSQPAFSVGWPTWSPDSRQILFNATVGGQLKTFLVGATGGEPIPLEEPIVGWSRDGRWTYLASQKRVWRKPAAGGEPKQLTQERGFFMGESPDGKSICYCRTTSPPSLWRVPTDGGAEAEILHAFDHPANCCVTDQGVYFVPVRNAAGVASSIQFLRFSTGKVELVAAAASDLHYGLNVSPDGRWLLYSQVDQATCDLMLVENFR